MAAPLLDPGTVSATPRQDPRPEAATEDPSSHLRTRFLRRIAHDIASPAGVTMTVLDELATETARPELVAMARRGIRRLLRLSDQLALVADLEAGPVTPDAAREDVRALVESAVEQATTIDGRRDVTVTCDLPDAPLFADVDRRLLGSVLREVVGNALRLASSRVRVHVTSEDRRAVVRVHDDGPGFSAEALAGLGQRFTERSTVRGLGVSLSIAKQVLAAHRGELAVEASALPAGRRGVRGAAVVVRLPLA